MLFSVYLIYDIGYHAITIDNKCSASRSHKLFAVSFFLNPNAIFLSDGLIRVGNQRKRKIVLLAEFTVRSFIVGAYSKDRITFSSQLVAIVAKVSRLRSASRCLIFGIEIKNDLLSFEVGKADLLTILVFSGKVRGFITDLER